MSRKLRVAVACLAVAVLAMTLAGCQAVAEKATQTAVEKATGVKVDESGKKVTLTGKDGAQAPFGGEEGKIPEGVPADFPNYDGAVKDTASAETPEGSSYSYLIETPDAIKTVFEWYKKELKNKGWTVESSRLGNEGTKDAGASIVAKKGESDQVDITMTVKEDKTEVMTILTLKKK